MARVEKPFRDRLTGRILLVGDDYQGSPERIAELAENGYVEGPSRRPRKDDGKSEGAKAPSGKKSKER